MNSTELINMVIVIGIILLLPICYILYLKYDYIFIKDKNERRQSKELNKKFDEYTDKKITKREFAEWIVEKQKENWKLNRKRKLDKLNGFNSEG